MDPEIEGRFQKLEQRIEALEKDYKKLKNAIIRVSSNEEPFPEAKVYANPSFAIP